MTDKEAEYRNLLKQILNCKGINPFETVAKLEILQKKIQETLDNN